MANYDGKVVIGTALDNSGLIKGAKSVAGSLGGLAKVVARVTGVITAAFGAAAVAITKQAVDAYADYEQLAGGVETLFKDSAEKVKQYANDAFFAVGVSANEYMSMVTGFSASLISALGGDTARAADVANMAMVDMADNANKMGSTLESIQNAYQGFAKQNYTMLDNLKLGYGGTKTEMERLLADARKLTGVKYNINNLADVYSAIHAIQEEMGIAGATAKEAEGTITGSAAMTKAAWQNVLSAIAGGGDLDRAINNLVYSISKYFENIVPVVERSLAGIGQLIERIAPQLVQTVAASLIRAIPSLLNAVYQMIIGLAQGIAQGIKALFTGGEIKPVTKQLESVADGFESAAGGAEDLAASTEKAGKAAKKYLAGFDEITKISKDSGSSSGTESFGNASFGASTSTGVAFSATLDDVGLSSAVQSTVDKILTYFEPLRNINFDPLKESISSVGEAFVGLLNTVSPIFDFLWFDVLVPLSTWTIEEAAPQALETLASGFNLVSAALSPLGKLLKEIYDSILRPMAAFIGENFIIMLQEWRNGFDKVAAVFAEKAPQIDHIVQGIGAGLEWLWSVAEPIFVWIREQWQEMAQAIADFTAEYIGMAIDELDGIVTFLEGVFSADWEKAWDGIAQAVKAPINMIIGFVNGMISAVVDGINTIIKALNKLSFDVPDWVPGIGGETWGFDISKIKAPEIPYLAKGAVIPPNAPFMAVLGDQRRGTNIEAPLATIQEAVALVMEDFAAANIAGQEAIIAVLRDILEAVLGIEVGDDVIGAAVDRYQRKMRIVRGEA